MAITSAPGIGSGTDAASAVIPAQGSTDSARAASSGDAFGTTMSDSLREADSAARGDAGTATPPTRATGTSTAGDGNSVPPGPASDATAEAPVSAADQPADATNTAAATTGPTDAAANDDSLARLLADIDAMRGAAATTATGTAVDDASTAATAGEAAGDGEPPADADQAADPTLLACALPTTPAVPALPAAASALATGVADGTAAACAGSVPGVGQPGANPGGVQVAAAAEPVAAALADADAGLDGQADTPTSSAASDALASPADSTGHADAATGSSTDGGVLPSAGANHAQRDDGAGSLPRTDGGAASPAGETRPAGAPRVSAMGELFAQLQPSGLAEQVSQRVVWMHQLGVHIARMQVHPSDLGPIDIALNQQDGGIAVSMTAHHPATRELLESHLPRMREQLAADGANIERFDVFGGDGRGDDGREAREGSGDGRSREEGRDTIEAAPAIRLPIRAAGLFEAYA